MKSFALLYFVALCGSTLGFAPQSSFMPNQMAVNRGSSLMTMNAAERTYIMVSGFLGCCKIVYIVLTLFFFIICVLANRSSPMVFR